MELLCISCGCVPEQALALMAAFKDEWPCLIIVPPALRGAGSRPTPLMRPALLQTS